MSRAFPRGVLAAISAVAVLTVSAPPARAADLVVFHAPPDAGAEGAAARAVVLRVAAAAGAAFLDLSPQPPPAPAAPALLARGIEQFAALRLDEAAAALDAALDEARRTGGAGLTPLDLSDLFLHRSLVRGQRGDAVAAWDELVRAATVDATRHLDAARFPPKVIQGFHRAVAAVRAGAHGRLVVEAPPGCRVHVDGRTADGLELPFGEHFVRVECPGRQPTGAVVVLALRAQTADLPRAPIGSPADAALAELARERQAARLLAAVVTTSSLAPPTLRLRLIDAGSGAVLSDASSATADVERVRSLTERLLTVRSQDRPMATERTPARWYTRPWVWALAGAAVTAAVLLPFVVERGSPSGFSVTPAGDLWAPR